MALRCLMYVPAGKEGIDPYRWKPRQLKYERNHEGEV